MKKQRHPFPMYIEAHSGSSVIVGGYGHTSTAGSASAPMDELEADLLRVFRSFPLRERVDIMNHLYRYEATRREQREKIKIAPACKGKGKKTGCCGADS